jgi:hypothetical protein
LGHHTIAHLAYAYNTTVHSVHGFTPFYLFHGYNPSSAYILYMPGIGPSNQSKGDARAVDDFRRFHAQCLKQAPARLEQDAVSRRAAAMPPRHWLPKISVGDHV